MCGDTCNAGCGSMASSGALERAGFKGITKTLVTDAEKRVVLSGIRSQLAKGVKPNTIVKNITSRATNAVESYIRGGLPEGFTEAGQGAQEIALQSVFNNLALEEGQEGFDVPEIDQIGKILLEQFIVGKFSGGIGPAAVSAFSSPNVKYEKIASDVIKGTRSVAQTIETTKSLIATGKITSEQGIAFLENLKIAEAAKASLPNYVTNKEQRKRAISLIMERNAINKSMEGADPDLQDGYKSRLEEIKSELKSIADKKWVAPVSPVITSSVAGFETAMDALTTDNDQQKSARIFNATVQSQNNGLMTKVVGAMNAGRTVSGVLLDKMAERLQAFADRLDASTEKTPELQKAIATARDLAQKMTNYNAKVESETNGTIPGLNMPNVMARIEAGVEAGDIDFMENTPEEIAMAFSDIMDGKDVSDEDAKTVADFLYDRYSKLRELKQTLNDKLNKATSESQIKKYKNAIFGIDEVLKVLDGDIETAVSYQKEKAFQLSVKSTQQGTTTTAAEPTTQAAPAQATELANEYDPANAQELTDQYNQNNEFTLREEVIKALNSVAKLLAKIAPNVKIYAHTGPIDFRDALLAEGVRDADTRTMDAGAAVYNSDGKIASIHINLYVVNTKPDSFTGVYHEAVHVIFDTLFGENPGLVADMAKAIKKVIPSSISEELTNFLVRYETDPEETKTDEFVTELTAILAKYETQLDKTTKSKIIEVINRFIEMAADVFGIKLDKYLLQNEGELIDFINSAAVAVRSGLSSDIAKKQTEKIQRKYAVQEQAAGEVPIRAKSKASRGVAQGEPQAGPQGVTEEGKAKAQEKKNYISGSELFKINAAPYYRTKVNKFSEALSLHKSRAYIRFKEDFSKITEDLNLEIVSAIDSIGGWAGTSEVSTVFFVKGTWDDAVTAAALMGITAPEVQDSTIAAQIVEDGSDLHNVDRFEIKVNNPELAFKALREVSFEQDGYTIVDDTIWLLDFSKGSDPEFFAKFDQLEKTIKSYGAEIISTDRKPVRSELIDDEGEYGSKREEVISEFERSSVQQGRKRGYISDNLEAIKERLNAFKRWKGIDYSPEKARLEELRRKEIELASQFKSLSKKESEELSRLTAKLADVYASVIASDKARYEEAKTEIEQIAEEVRVLVNKSFVSEFPVKRAQRGGEKVARWYFGDVTALGDGARTNIIVNTESDAEFLYEAILKTYPDDSVRSERESTVLGYPKRLVEIRTSNGKRAEIQVMTPEGYLAKDGLKYFREDLKADAKRYFDNVRKNLGWNIPDGIGHYFYEIHRDPNVPSKIRKMAEPLSTAYYNAMLNSDTSTLTDQEFRDSVSEFKNLVDNADKSRWDKSNSGKSPAELDQYLGEQGAEPAVKVKASRGQAEGMGYNPNQAADKGSGNDRKLQQDIYDAAMAIYDKVRGMDLLDVAAYVFDEVEKKTGVSLNPVQTAELIKDLNAENRPEYAKDQSGKYRRVGTRSRKGSVMNRVITAISQLDTDRRVNKSIIKGLISALKGGPQYTVEKQADAEAIRDTIFDVFGGVANLEAAKQIYDIAQTTLGGLRSSMFARLANDAYNKARDAKSQEERAAFREIGQRAMLQLAEEATNAGRFNAMIYRIQQLNPEFIVQLELQKIREQTTSQMSNPGKKKRRVQKVATAINQSQQQAAQQATQSSSVQSAISGATGSSPTITSQPTQKSPGQKNAQKQAPAPTAPLSKIQAADKNIKDLKKKLSDIFKGPKTKAARSLPAGIDAEILDIISELARNYIIKGYTDKTALLAKVAADVAAAGGSIGIAYYNQMWVDVSVEA